MQMTQSTVREKAKPKDKTKIQHPCESILVSELKVGDEIGTVFGFGKYDEKVILKSKKVEQIEECPSLWRTHIHVNRNECYDTRHWVVVKS